MSLLVLFQVARLIPFIVIFAVAAWMDHKYGEVSNKLWLYAPVGCILALVELFVFTPYLLVIAVPVMVFTALFGFGLFFVSKVIFNVHSCFNFYLIIITKAKIFKQDITN